jgi:hypothetical protein
MTPTRRVLLGSAIASVVAAVVVHLGGCSNDQYIPLPIFEASTVDALPVDLDAAPDGSDAPAEGAADAPGDAQADAEGGDGGAGDSPADAPPDAPSDAVLD